MRDPAGAIAQYFYDTLTKDPGKEIHWLELAAGAEHTLRQHGVRVEIDPWYFSRCMRRAKILGLAEGENENPFPIYERRGFWRVRPSPLTELRAIERAVRSVHSRFQLLLAQAESEDERDPGRERYEAAAELRLLRRSTWDSMAGVRRLIQLLEKEEV